MNEKSGMENRFVNSREYWEYRFSSGDWNKFEGNRQSEFFAQLAVDNFPEWLKDELSIYQWNITDIGCAQGDGSAVLARNFPSCHVTGIDFSENAINNAKERFPYCDFSVGNITLDIRKTDVIFSSNTLEHLKNPRSIMEKICNAVDKYAIFILPFEDKSGISEHFYIFNRRFFPVQIGKCYLNYFKIIDCNNSPYWNGQQILLIYVNSDYKPLNEMTAENIYINFIREYDGKITLLSSELSKTEEKLNESLKYIQTLEARNKDSLDSIAKLEDEISILTNEKEVLERNKKEMAEQIKALENKVASLSIQLDSYKNKVTELNITVKDLLNKQNAQINAINGIKRYVLEARNLCYALTATKLFRFVHFISRLKRQGIHNTKEERRIFIKWFLTRSKFHSDGDRRFNPMFGIIGLLDKALLLDNCSNNISSANDRKGDSKYLQHIKQQELLLNQKLSQPLSEQAKAIEKIILDKNYKGILVYPHVVFWEPLQTPQQLLRAFAKEGWLCFFCESNNLDDVFREVEPNLWIVYEQDLLQALSKHKELQIYVLLTWMGSISFVNALPNKKIWYHILDHLSIFAYYDEEYQKVHDIVVNNADLVSYVAHPLKKFTNDRPDALYLPNGCNPEEFLNQHTGYIPDDIKSIVLKKHKIIGYYGYLAEWMDYDLICSAAKARPNYEFVFIGKAIYDVSKIENLPNVHLLGYKPYKELSDYAKFFDVAVIPFLVNEQMYCVSPIKFYEYCALGLPVVSSRMKELEAYACDFIACVTDINEFLDALDRFTSTDIKNKARKYGPDIAAKNTWTARAKTVQNKLVNENRSILCKPYTKYDVIILSIIDFDFRYQRPQHFATRFAKNGHRVFYINANHHKDNSVNQISENLFIVNLKNDKFSAIHLTDWSSNMDNLKLLLDNILYRYCIRDAITVVEYPNWLHAAEYLRHRYGFKIITDYMDDFTGFLNPEEKLVSKNCKELLMKSDMIIASSQFLYDIALQYNNKAAIVRNGAEYEHFNKAFGKKIAKDKKIIGYYGAIAHWFDVEKVCYVARHLPDCDIVLIGEVTEGKEKFEKYPNIKLLGEIPYSELPTYLETFDVCLIPFDTKTDLIKATNPVKFYEYLCAGKKIVATEIPELIPYKDKYVYLANDNQEFLNYICLCLNGKDILASPEECAKFGRENDWQNRYEKFAELCEKAVPHVNIIVLTYNNLELNKHCIQSIFNKTAYPRFTVTIVDNNSTDGTREYLKELKAKPIKNLNIILNDENKGFAGGNNIGICACNADYILLLNNDTIVTRGWLTSLVKHMENDPSLGMCGPVTNSIENEAKIPVNYHNINELEIFSYEYTWNHMNEEWKDPNVLAFFCTIIRNDVINKCGLLDESYKVGMFEDDDYAEAVRKAGYRLTIAEDAFIHHFGSSSFRSLDYNKYMSIFNTNKQIYENKWGKRWQRHVHRPGVTHDTNKNTGNILLERW